MANGVDYIIFTDGSVLRKTKHAQTHAGYGVVLYNVATHQYTTFGGELGTRTIAFAEAWAIHKGLAILASLVSKPASILVLSDSKICVLSLTQYIHAWLKSAGKDNVWYTADHHPVQNQVIYKLIQHTIKTHPKLTVQISHINSHLLDKEHGRIATKLAQAGFHVDEQTAKAIIKMNALADSVATKYSHQLEDAATKNHFFQLQPTKAYYQERMMRK